MKSRKCIALFLPILLGHLLFAQRSINTDSLWQVVNTSKQDAEVVSSLVIIGDEIFFAYPDSALQIFERAEKIANKAIGNSATESKAIKTIQAYLAVSYQDEGSIYLQKGEVPEALKYYNLALKLYEKWNMKSGIAGVLNNIGLLYQTNLNDMVRALDCYNRSLKLLEELHDKYKSAIVLGNIGVIYKAQGNIALAIDYYNRSEKLSEEIKNTSAMADIAANFAEIYRDQQDIPKAIEEGYKSLKLHEEDGDMLEAASNMLFLGNIFLAQGQLEKAKEMTRMSLQIAKKNNFRDNIMDAALLEHKILKKQGKYQESLAAYELYVRMRDSLENKNAQVKSIRDLVYFENQAKSLADSIKFIGIEREKDKEIGAQQMLLEKQTKFRSVWIAATLIIFILGILIYTVYRRNFRQKQNQLLINSLETEQKLLRAQMNPHFIYNALNSIQSLILANEPRLAREYLVTFSRLTRAILEQTRKKLIPFNKEIEILRLYLNMEKLRFKDKFDYEIILTGVHETENIFIPPLIIQPFVENSILHGIRHKSGKGKIDIEFSRNNGTLKCTVQDNGIGRTKAEEINSLHPMPGLSIATQLAKNRLALMAKNGTLLSSIHTIDLTDEHGDACGTKTEINIPLTSTDDKSDNY